MKIRGGSSKKGALSWLYKNSKGQQGKMLCLILSNALLSVLSVAFAFGVKAVIDGAVGRDKDKLVFGIIFIISIVILQFIFRLITGGLIENIRGKLEIAYKSRIFSKILTKKYAAIQEYHSGELMNRLTQDVSVVADGVTSIVPSVAASVVRLICAVAALVALDWIFAIAFVVAGALVFIILGVLRGKLKSLHKKSLESDGAVRSFMQESVENSLALKVFSINDKIEKKSDELQTENFKWKMRRKNYAVFGSAAYNLIFSAGYLFALIYGGACIFNGTGLSYGDLSAILQLVNNVQVPFASLSSAFPKYYAMIASAERLIEIERLEEETVGETVTATAGAAGETAGGKEGGEKAEKVGAAGKTATKKDAAKLYGEMRAIVAEDLSFSYGREQVFKGAYARIEKGDFVAVTGASGIGKSTFVKLMLGVYDLGGGEIYFDTENGKIPANASTRALFSYVPQGNMLFSGTLLENVTFINDEATDEEIARALEIGCVKDFLGELPEGLNTKVGENGVGLSEGQIQRVAIARAVLTGAPIILLDEATSALDAETELKVLRGLKEIEDKTLIFISHKAAALSICNKELRVSRGKFAIKELKNETED